MALEVLQSMSDLALVSCLAKNSQRQVLLQKRRRDQRTNGPDSTVIDGDFARRVGSGEGRCDERHLSGTGGIYVMLSEVCMRRLGMSWCC